LRYKTALFIRPLAGITFLTRISRPDGVRAKVTRREFAGGAACLGALSTLPAFTSPAAAVSAPPTTVLVNETALRQKYPRDADWLLDTVRRFARRQNGEIVRVDGNQSAPDIKARLRRLARRPRRLVIFGDETSIPRFTIKAPNVELQVDWFYGDLDGDGLSEVAIARVLGSPRAMANQLGELPDETYLGRLVTYSGPEYVGEVRESAAGRWIENNQRGRNIYRPVSDTGAVVVLQNVDNDIQFKLDLVARQTFWRHGTQAAWQPNYEIVEIIGQDAGAPKPGVYNRVAYRRQEGPVTDFGQVRRVDSARWLEINRDATNNYRLVSESASELVLHNPNNNIQFRLDIATRKCFWRRGATDGWQPNYDIVDVEPSDAVAGEPGASKTVRAIVFSALPQAHLETNVLASLMGDLGCAFETRDWPDLQALARAEVVYFCGHGNRDGWYGGITGTIVTTPRVPVLQSRPVVYAGACSTAVPGAPILRAFMERGCRVYVGATSDSYGFTPAANGNELMMHLMDSARSYPDSSIAELTAEARNRFVRNNHLAPVMLALERGRPVDVDPVAAHTALQWIVFGDVTATHPRSKHKTVFSPVPFGSNHVAVKPGGSTSCRLSIGAGDGIPTLFFRGQWDRNVSAGLRIDVVQNGEVMHRLDWREQREYWAFTEGQAGGYFEGGRYHAFAVLPLMRQSGENDVTLHVAQASNAILVRSESSVQKWPKRRAPRLPAPRLARQEARNLLWLRRNDDTGPMRGALRSISRLNYLEQVDFGDRLAVFEFPDEPQHLLDLSNFDAILIDDVESGYRAFPRGIGAKVRAFVTAGGSLIMAGGSDSFNGKYYLISQGGYGGTPIEEVLPVRMIRPDDRVEGRMTVSSLDPSHSIAAGLTGTMPAIFGYNKVAAKPGSKVLARTASGDPLLVVGQYGKGRVAAFMTRSNRDWGVELKTWEYYNRFWANLIRWVLAV
jgi:uncharacterized membrane protein